jgi:hypothetical protein
MKNIKAKVFLTAVILLSVAGLADKVFAASSYVNVSPSGLNKTVGDTFSVDIGVNASGNKVCVVEGTMTFNRLSCQSISVTTGLQSVTAPTCSNPYFMIGIPSCTTSSATLFSMSVRADSAGSGTVGFSGVDILGEGVSIGSSSVNGNYTISAVVVPTTAPTSAPTAVPTSVPTTAPTSRPVVNATSTPVPTSALTPTITPTMALTLTPTLVEFRLFDIALNLESALITKSNELVSRTQFTSFGNVPTLVNLIYRIEDPKGRVMYTDNAEVTVETEKLVSKDFKTLDLPVGKYTLFLTTSYGNDVKDEFKQAFEIKDLSTSNEAVVYTVWIVVIVIVLGVGIFLILRSVKRGQKEEITIDRQPNVSGLQ